ncbi:hypothetical protein DQ04_00571180 [Trypanosoma grayi]|uniref:hypothetical protein n=1 Tax=Trypanosoma grayi TaxID=71804 RepID=UPI0004F43DDB|nr:hypothetical protein DQ04_00571180 [Trypanosoma grayi]KEG14223.1 hypothetical protein DQ04_00571180 [Trypanosoma grayi]
MPPEASTPPSDASSYSSSASSGSSGAGSSSSSSSSEEGEDSHDVAPRALSRNVNSSAPSNISTPGTDIRRVQMNPGLQFEKPDSSWIETPPSASYSLRGVVANYDVYPEGRYRLIDYFRTAMEMFLTQVRQEYKQQYNQAQKNGRTMTRFTWRNKGELAICFAVCCDMLKLMYDRFRPGPERPTWEDVVDQFIRLLMNESRIPSTILTQQTYNTKFLDWRKGGTRYQGEQLASNVRFPSAEERRVKIETYLRSGVGYAIESTAVEVPALMRSVTAAVVEESANSQNTRSGGSAVAAVTSGHPISRFTGFPRGQAPVKMPAKTHMKAPPPLVAGKQAVDKYRHLQWLARLEQITGVSRSLEFPEERSHMILAFVRFCETSEMPDHFVTIMNILVRSVEKIQDGFERGGGMVVLRRFVDTLVRLKDTEGLTNLLEQILQMKLSVWSNSSRQSWLRDMLGISGNDLTWLRTLDIIPVEKGNAWVALVTALEQRYILAEPREDDTRRVTKRARLDADEVMRLSRSDNVGVSMQIPSITTSLCVSLPGEFRAPPLSSTIEQDTISFLNKKLRFCEEAQASWREAILGALNGRCPGLPIPLWYDTYQLLGVDPL